MSEERLFKFILKCNRRLNVPDLHSFTVSIDGGVAFVDCRGFEVYVEAHIGDKKDRFAGTEVGATNYLEAHGAKYESIEM